MSVYTRCKTGSNPVAATAAHTADPNSLIRWLLSVSADLALTNLVRGLNSGRLDALGRPWSVEAELQRIAVEFIDDHKNACPCRIAADLPAVLDAIARSACGQSIAVDREAGRVVVALADAVAGRAVTLLLKEGRKPKPSARAALVKLAESIPAALPLDILLSARHHCRNGLGGLRVGYRGRVEEIRSTQWDADSNLVVFLDGPGSGPVPAAELVLLDAWPARCCRPSAKLLREAMARRDGRS